MTPHDRFPLRTVSRLTGLSPDVIRAWEKRYNVVTPIRGPRGARLYTRADMEHLSLLGRLVAQGRAIGDVARLEAAALRALVDEPTAGRAPAASSSATVAAILECVERFDLRQLDVRLGDALLAHGAVRFVQDVAQPLLVEVGERWASGRMTVADEHLVSAALRRLLSGLLRLRPSDSSAGILLATPAGEQHEIGLMLVALIAVESGVKIYFLGSDLPAAEIVGAAQRANAAVVGLSVVNADNRDNAVEQVRAIERALRPSIELWIGGADAPQLAPRLESSRTLLVHDPVQVQFSLDRLRDHAGPMAS